MPSKTADAPEMPPSFAGALVPMILTGLFAWLAHFFGLRDFVESLMGDPDADGTEGRAQMIACASLGLLFFVDATLSVRVVNARRKHNVKLPFMYPSPYNGEEVKDPIGYMKVVRAHENFLEGLPWLLTGHLILQLSPVGSPLHSPALAALGTSLSAIGRVIYAYGYASEENPDKRLLGLLLYRIGLGLVFGVVLSHGVNLL